MENVSIGDSLKMRRIVRVTNSRAILALIFHGLALVVLNGQETASGLLQRAVQLADLYNWREALPYFQRAERLFTASGDERNALYARIGVIRSERASIMLQSHKLSDELATNPILQQDEVLRMFCLAAKGDLDGEIDPSAMRSDWEQVLELARKVGDNKWQYRAQGQLGFAAFYAGNLAEAQGKVAFALIEATKAGDVGAQIFFLTATAVGLRSQSMNEQALLYTDKAIKLAAANPDTGYPAVAQQTRLQALVGLGRTLEAERLLKELLSRDDVRNSPYQIGRLLSTASKLARAGNQDAQAISYLDEAIQHVRKIGNDRDLAEYESDLAGLYLKANDLSKAEDLAKKSFDSSMASGELPFLPRRLLMLAQVQIRQGRFGAADQTFDRAAAIQDVLIGNADSILGKTALIQGASDLYAKHFALLVGPLANVNKSFSILEQARGRVMTELLFSGTATLPDSLETERKISQLRLKLMETRSDQQIRDLREEIFLAEQSRSIVPETRILRRENRRQVALRDVQSVLTGSEMLLEYVLDEPQSYCLVVTNDDVSVVTLPGKTTVESLVKAYLKAVKAKEQPRDLSRRLFDTLLAPVHKRGARQLIIVRDGSLHLLPFDALVGPDGRYFVENHQVAYSPSAATFQVLRSNPQASGPPLGVLAVGGVPYDRSGLRTEVITRGHTSSSLANLPSSRDEAISVSVVFPNASNVLLLGNRATESSVKKAADHRVIHFAVHAVANDVRPDRSAIVLLPDPAANEDGFLQASEIVQLKLNADLAVLSACDTGVGPVSGQEGISTLARAFLLAGARTVISTLWAIEDETTSFLMNEFYIEFKKTRNPVSAMTTAKRKMLKTFGPKALPYYWAGFSVEGAFPASRGKN